ncbi:MAG: glycoside hydrolase family 2 TIM barrel-domain containing protein [Clostridiales bacterium]|nr:glycoside hydrolase family 2 TIM barrel-domain containing protein [Clostridiales bacterium]
MGERIYLNDNWKFTGEYSESLLEREFDDTGLETVRLPHTCKETPFHYFDESIYQMLSGYRKVFRAPTEWKGKKILLTIDGAAHDSEVFLNGKKVGEHHCGYTAFTVDLSQHLLFGEENVLVVKVDSRENLNIPPFGFVIDYMTYGGIYREVYLEINEPLYLSDVFVRSELQDFVKKKGRNRLASGKVVSEIFLNEAGEEYTLIQSIRKKGETEFKLLGEKKESQNRIQMQFPVNQIELWDTEKPVLYEMKTELKKDGNTVDEKTVIFGFRSAVFLQDGFYLNGEKIKIRGLNRHQSYPYVGYAMPKSMQTLDADIIKNELGVNAVRTSHYPQSHYFLDRCDEIGLLIFTEIPGWQHIGDEEWKNQAVENVKDMVVQYRNHASIILWGVRINESQDDDAFYKRTNQTAHELDVSRQTGGVRAHKKSSLLEDVYTYNDFLHDGKQKGCEPKKAVTSDMSKPYLVSEYNGHMYPTKSFDWEEHRVEHAIRHANVLDAIAGEEDIAGSFGWCMFDYNTHKDFGSGDRICYHGVMDMFRNPKLAAVIYACQQEKEPVLEISSSMDIGEHPGCNRGAIWILTNADSVRMYKNDRFIKEYEKGESPYRNLAHGPIMIDDFIGDAIKEQENFKPAQANGIKDALNATARYGLSNLPKSVYLTAIKMMLVYHMKPEQAVELYNRYIGDWGGTSTTYRFEAVKDGKVVKTVTKEPVKSIHLKVEADHTVLREETTYDVAAVRIQALDQNDNLLSFYQEPLQLEVTGSIELIGDKTVSLQGGMGGAYVKTTGESGVGELKIISSQTGTKTIKFEVQV